MTRILLVVAALAWSLVCQAPSAPQPPAAAAGQPAPQRAVLVTGASSGIGRRTAEVLAAKGFFVYACARKEADLKELDAIDNVQAIRLDVTKSEDIEAAVKTVREAGRGLYGLVNNAGVGAHASFAETTEEQFDQLVAVQFKGPFFLTQKLLPLLSDGGRSINISSGLTRSLP